MLVTTLDRALEAIQQFDFSKVSFDVETLDVKWYNRWAHGGSYEKGNPTGVSFFNGTDSIYIDTCGWSGSDMQALCDELQKVWAQDNGGKGRTIIAHNIPFDINCLNKYGVKLWNADWFCTMTASHLIDETRVDRRAGGKGHGLKQLAKEILGQEEVVPWQEARFKQDVFRKYAVNDAVWTWELAWRFAEELEHQGLGTLFYKIEMPFQRVLCEMEKTGVLVDIDRVHRVADELEQALVEKEIEMYELIGEPYEIFDGPGPTQTNQPINFKSSSQLAEVMFDRLGLAVIETTPGGKRSTGKATLLAHKKHPFVKILIQYKIITKLLSAFFSPLPAMVDPDGRVRPQFRNTGTATGRLSCASPNMQQQPRKTKEFPVDTRACFVAPKGYKMVACDFSQQETRIMAELSRDPSLISILQNQGDIHLFSANNVFQLGIPEEKLYETHPEYEQIKEQYKEQRTKAKIFTFGIPYGMTEHKAAKDFDISLEEGKRLMDNFFAGFPLLKKAIEQAHKDAEKNLYVKTYTGRKRRFTPNNWGRLDQSALRQAFNFYIQSFGADLMRISQVALLKYAARNPHMGLKQIMAVHDEVVFIVKEEYAEQAARDTEAIFARSWDLIVPLKAEANIGNNYGEVK